MELKKKIDNIRLNIEQKDGYKLLQSELPSLKLGF
jgi:hypothetical protein